MESQSKVIYNIVEYLQSLKANGADAAKMDSICDTLRGEFLPGNCGESFKENSYYPTTSLAEIFEAGVSSLKLEDYSMLVTDAKSNPKFESFVETVTEKGYFDGVEEGSVEYLQRYTKLMMKFKVKMANAAPSKQADEDVLAKAEDLKFKGNAAINAKEYDEAILCYTQALELSPEGENSHVYHSNRAAAYCHQKKYEEAAKDCEDCLALNPEYVKAYSRLGLTNFFLGRYNESVAAYERAVELEPDSKANQDSLRQARNKLRKQQAKNAAAAAAVPSSSSSSSGLPPGMPPAMMNNPAVKNAMDQMGGPAGLAGLMKDPQMMSMAQQMMKDPAMMQQAMSMLGGGGAAGTGGMPDMSALAGMMGGLGGGAGAGAPGSSSSGDVPSSSSGKAGAKKPFTGFED